MWQGAQQKTLRPPEAEVQDVAALEMSQMIPFPTCRAVSGGGILLGRNANASDGTAGTALSSGAGGGGSWGCAGLTETSTGKSPTGAGGGSLQQGGDGACRIVWGTGFLWPSNVPALAPCTLT